MNWGKGITLALIAFAGMMAYFLIRASGNPSPLVTDKYYEQELKYQQRINNTNRADALSADVVMQITANGIRLEFPKEIDPGTFTGELTLLRPNNPTLDKTIAVMASSDGIFEIEGDLLAPGRYNALLEWKAGESAYYSEQRIVVQ